MKQESVKKLTPLKQKHANAERPPRYNPQQSKYREEKQKK
jgi:hypothetical protein